jgi:putative membrane protein insertion efficiency factor
MNDPQPSLAIRITYRFYKSVLSPILHAFSPSQCLYLPTCSEYAYVALVRFGVFKGSWLALQRLARCHPFAKGGLDPVPASVPSRNSTSAGSVSIPTDHLP